MPDRRPKSVDDLFGGEMIRKKAEEIKDSEVTFDSYGNPDIKQDDEPEDSYIEMDVEGLTNLFSATDYNDLPDDDEEPQSKRPNMRMSGLGEAEEIFVDPSQQQTQARSISSGMPDNDDDDGNRTAEPKPRENSATRPIMSPVFNDMLGNGAERDAGDAENGLADAIQNVSYDEDDILNEAGGDFGVENRDDDVTDVDIPDWADSIRRKVNANVAHAFLLHGNVRDYMVRNLKITDGIIAVLDPDFENFDIIAEYDQAHGLYFYGSHIDVGNGRTLAEAYRDNFLQEMKKSLERMSMPALSDIPNRDPVMLFTILSDIFKHPSETRESKILLFIDYADLLVPDASSAQMKPEERKLAITLADIGRSQDADEAGNVMIFRTDDITQLSIRIRNADSRIEQIKIPIPNLEDRTDFIDNVLDVDENTLSDGTQLFEHADSISKEMFAMNSAGLSRMQIEDIVLRALSNDEPLTMQLMKERKQEIIKEDYDDVLEIVDPAHGFERIGGLDHLKHFFREEIIEPVHAGEKEAVPMGCILMGPPGTSKAISFTLSNVLLTTGKTLVKDVVPGDKIFGTDGKLHNVLGVSPQGYQQLYCVTFDDGRQSYCTADHVWTVLEENNGEWTSTDITAQEMLEAIAENNAHDKPNRRIDRAKFRLKLPKAADYPEQVLPIEPYTLGKLLGNWHNDEDNAELRAIDAQSCCSSPCIPIEYMYASAEQRRNLLQGFIDSSNNQTIENTAIWVLSFSSERKSLACNVKELSHSLGYVAVLTQSSNEQDINVCYHVRIDYNRDWVGIEDVQITDKYDQCACLLTDCPEHLFLIDDYIPTHNTFLSKAVAKECGMNFVALNLNRLMDKWLGATERNLERALECAMAMSPTIIFIDEIDEALPNRADPNAPAVNKRINQRLLTFFSETEHRGDVIILAATNYPEKVDPAFKRAGRFDVRLPMFAPDQYDRMRIIQIIAESRGYKFSWFESPDKMVPNPFVNLKEWIYAGNAPINEKNFVGDKTNYEYVVPSEHGEEPRRYSTYLPKKLISIIGKEKITLQQFYEGVNILLEDMPARNADASSGEIISDDEYKHQIEMYLRSDEVAEIIGDDDKNLSRLLNRIWRWEIIYKPFCDQTYQMTGAELDVVMNKAITTFKRYKRKIGDAGVAKLIAQGVIKDDRDIPWQPFLLDACLKTVNAVAGIKQMEDMALLNTSDLDFIPDAMYARGDNGRIMSYHERQEELTAKQVNAGLA